MFSTKITLKIVSFLLKIYWMLNSLVFQPLGSVDSNVKTHDLNKNIKNEKKYKKEKNDEKKYKKEKNDEKKSKNMKKK